MHANYHEIETSGPQALGRALGAQFGDRISAYIDDARDEEDWSWQRHQAKQFLELTNHYFPSYIDELQAYADAAGLQLLDLWTVAIEDELSSEAWEKCTSMVTRSGRLVGHNEDWSADAVDEICILKKRMGNTTSLELYYYGCPLGGVALSISSRGVVQAINTIASETECRVGVPKSVIARRLSEGWSDPAEFNEILSVPRSSGYAHTFINRDMSVTSIECTAGRFNVSKPDSPFVHTNHIVETALAEASATKECKRSQKRYRNAAALAPRATDVAGMKAVLSNRDNGKSTSVLNKNTIASAIVDLENFVAHIWLKREQAKGWVAYPIDFFRDDWS